MIFHQIVLKNRDIFDSDCCYRYMFHTILLFKKKIFKITGLNIDILLEDKISEIIYCPEYTCIRNIRSSNISYTG